MRGVLFRGCMLSAIAVLGGCAASNDKAEANQFCHEGVCIPDSNDPNHPKFHLDVPVAASGGNEENYGANWVIPGACGTTQQSGWYSIGADDSESAMVQTPLPNCTLKSSSYYRNHWTVTCWRNPDDWGKTYTGYECHNWNTVFGDSWAFMFIAFTEGS